MRGRRQAPRLRGGRRAHAAVQRSAERGAAPRRRRPERGAPEAANEAWKAASRSPAPSMLITYASKGSAAPAAAKYLRGKGSEDGRSAGA